MISAICTIGSPSSRDATVGVLRSARTTHPEAELFVVGTGFSPRYATTLDAAELTAGLGIVIGDVLTPEEEFLAALPFALERLLDEHESVVAVLPGVILQGRLDEIEALAGANDVVLVTPVGVFGAHHGTPRIDSVLHRPGYVSPLIFGVSRGFGPRLEEWKEVMAESFRHVMQASPGGLHDAVLRSFLGTPGAAVAGARTLIHLDQAALIATGHAAGPMAAAVECNLLWELTRLKRDASYVFDLTEDQLQFVSSHRSEWLDGLAAFIDATVAEIPAGQPPTPHERLVRGIRRASDPLGHRWTDRADFDPWLYTTAQSGLNRITHSYWASHEELRDAVPSALDDPASLIKWAKGPGVAKLGVDLTDGASIPGFPPTQTPGPRGVIARARHAFDWRWLTVAPAIPGHNKRVSARTAKAFSSRRSRSSSSAGFLPASDTLSVLGPFRSESGLGQAARGTLDALTNQGRPTSYIDTSDAYASRNAALVDLSHLRFGAVGDVNIVHANPPELLKWSDSVFAHRLGGRYNIAMWFWETTRLPPDHLPAFAMVDELWAASTYLAETFSHYQQVPVAVTGLAMDLPTKRSPDRSRFQLTDDEFVFLFAFDALSSHGRKNPVQALQAFIKAFAPRFEGVRFVLKVSNLDRAVGSASLRALAAEHEAIMLIDSYLAREDLLDLMAAADAYVSLHAAEGYGLTILESMALGTPAICTGYSGNMDFTNEGNSWLVDYELIATPADSGPYPAGSVWAAPSQDHAADLMRFAAGNRDIVASKGHQAALDAAKAVSLDRYATRISEELSRVL